MIQFAVVVAVAGSSGCLSRHCLFQPILFFVNWIEQYIIYICICEEREGGDREGKRKIDMNWLNIYSNEFAGIYSMFLHEILCVCHKWQIVICIVQNWTTIQIPKFKLHWWVSDGGISSKACATDDPNGIRCLCKMEMKDEQNKKSPMNFCWRIINDVGGESFRDEKLNFCFDERLSES